MSAYDPKRTLAYGQKNPPKRGPAPVQHHKKAHQGRGCALFNASSGPRISSGPSSSYSESPTCSQVETQSWGQANCGSNPGNFSATIPKASCAIPLAANSSFARMNNVPTHLLHRQWSSVGSVGSSLKIGMIALPVVPVDGIPGQGKVKAPSGANSGANFSKRNPAEAGILPVMSALPPSPHIGVQVLYELVRHFRHVILRLL